MAKLVRRILRIALGVVLLIAGLVLWLAPVLPGGILMIPGLLLLAPELPFINRWMGKLEARFPRLRHPIQASRRWCGHRPAGPVEPTPGITGAAASPSSQPCEPAPRQAEPSGQKPAGP